jgi:hypothetical protein
MNLLQLLLAELAADFAPAVLANLLMPLIPLKLIFVIL